MHSIIPRVVALRGHDVVKAWYLLYMFLLRVSQSGDKDTARCLLPLLLLSVLPSDIRTLLFPPVPH